MGEEVKGTVDKSEQKTVTNIEHEVSILITVYCLLLC